MATVKKTTKAKSGTSLGMKSVKSGYDKNAGVTRADFVAMAKGKRGMKVKKAQIGATQTPFEYRVNGPKVGPIQVKQNNVVGAQDRRRSDDYLIEQREIARDKRDKEKREIKKLNTPVKKGSSSPRPLTKSVKNYVKYDMKKGGSVKKTMKTGGKMTKKCAYGCK